MNNQTKKSLLAPLLTTILLTMLGCSSQLTDQTNYILDNAEKLKGSSESIEYNEKTLIHETDIPKLFMGLDALETRSEKKNVVRDYIVLNERLSCILDKISESEKNDSNVQCQGDTIVEIDGQNGLPGIETIIDMLSAEKETDSKRILLSGYLEDWTAVQRINRVEKSLNQIKRTKEMPLLGTLLNSIHNFPIMYEGNVLVPKDDIGGLLEEFVVQKTDANQRSILTKYLDR